MQNQLAAEENDFSKKEYQSVTGANSGQASKCASIAQNNIKEDALIEQIGNDENERDDDLKAEKTIFDFFTKSMNTKIDLDQNQNLKTPDNFDGNYLKA